MNIELDSLNKRFLYSLAAKYCCGPPTQVPASLEETGPAVMSNPGHDTTIFPEKVTSGTSLINPGHSGNRYACDKPCLNFQLNFKSDCYHDGHNRKAPPYLYSRICKRVYTTIKKLCPIKFIVSREPPEGSVVRATAVFNCPPFSLNEHVMRCKYHASEDNDLQTRNHLVTCFNVGATYYDAGARGNLSGGNSVTFPWVSEHSKRPSRCGQSSSVVFTTTGLYKMNCFSSCAYSFDRRQIKLVFALETAAGEMLGTQSVDIKVCASPHRDKTIDESAIPQRSLACIIPQNAPKHQQTKPSARLASNNFGRHSNARKRHHLDTGLRDVKKLINNDSTTQLLNSRTSERDDQTVYWLPPIRDRQLYEALLSTIARFETTRRDLLAQSTLMSPVSDSASNAPDDPLTETPLSDTLAISMPGVYDDRPASFVGGSNLTSPEANGAGILPVASAKLPTLPAAILQTEASGSDVAPLKAALLAAPSKDEDEVEVLVELEWKQLYEPTACEMPSRPSTGETFSWNFRAAGSSSFLTENTAILRDSVITTAEPVSK